MYETSAAIRQTRAAAVEAQAKATSANVDVTGKIIGAMGDSLPHYQQGRAALLAVMDPSDQQMVNQIAPANATEADLPGIVNRLNLMQQSGEQRIQRHDANVKALLSGEYARGIAGELADTPIPERQKDLEGMLALVPDAQAKDQLRQKFTPLLGLDPDKMRAMSLTSEQQEQAAGRKATEARTAANEAETRRQGNVRLSIEQQQANIAAAKEAREAAAAGAGVTGSGPTGLPQAEPVGTRHPEALQSMPTGQAQIAKGIGDYTYPLPSGMALKTPYWQNLIEAATKYNPNLDISQYSVRLKARQDFTTGTAGKAINSLNTAIGHLDNLSRDSAALSNFGGFATPLNMLKNPIEKASGDTRQGAFTTDADAVATELTNVFRGSGGAEADVKAWRDNLDRDASQAQQQTNIQHAVGLLGSRLDALKQQYEKAVGEPMNFSLLNAKSAAILDRIAPGVIDTKSFAGSSGGKVTVVGKDGKSYDFPSQEKADAFKKAGG
jgi:hypothetical protein